MTLFRHTTRYYSDEFELNGVKNALRNLVESTDCGDAEPYYLGAAMTFDILTSHEDIRDQSVFLGLFDTALKENGIDTAKKGNYHA